MKKIFKALAITATAAAMCVGVGVAAGCNGAEQTYVGEYHYIGAHSPDPYGIVVEVTVKNNIITGIKEITNTKAAEDKQTYKDVIDGKEADKATLHTFTTVSPGWVDYYVANYDETNTWSYPVKPIIGNWGLENEKEIEALAPDYYGWSNASAAEWTDHESWLLQQYIGWSVADIMDLSVYTDYGYQLVTVDGNVTQQLDKNSKGEPYKVAYNASLNDSGLLISGATQGSGRLLLAVQDALSK